MSLYLDAYLPNEVQGCCPSKVYALVMNEQNQALKLNAGVWSFANYTAAAHASHAIVLAEHVERFKYYSTTLLDAQFTLPETPAGQSYYIEIWKRDPATGNNNYNRNDDSLKETRRFWWIDSKLEYFKVPAKQLSDIKGYVSHLSMSYDSELQSVKFVAWLELGGSLVEDPVECRIQWYDRNGGTILDTTASAFMTGVNGIYVFEQAGIDLTPDNSTPAIVTIKDASGTPHKSVSSVVTWD
jgi:hypothetical protein